MKEYKVIEFKSGVFGGIKPSKLETAINGNAVNGWTIKEVVSYSIEVPFTLLLIFERERKQ